MCDDYCIYGSWSFGVIYQCVGVQMDVTMTTRADKKAQEIAEFFASQTIPEIATVLPLVAEYNLSPKKRKILAVKAIPQCILLTEKRKAEVAGVSERYWHMCMSDPEFRKICIEVSSHLLGHHSLEVTNAFIRDAKLGSETNQRLLMQQYGVLDKPQVATGATQTVIIQNNEVKERKAQVVNRFRLEDKA